MIKEGASIDSHDNDGNTALILAAMRGHSKIVVLLLQNGANPHWQNDYGFTALAWAEREGHTVVATVLQHHETRNF